MAEMIVTPGGEEWEVLEYAFDDAPLTVRHAHPAYRGSFLEASLNSGLAMRQMKAAMRDALPSWMKRLIPPPRGFWAWLPPSRSPLSPKG